VPTEAAGKAARFWGARAIACTLHGVSRADDLTQHLRPGPGVCTFLATKVASDRLPQARFGSEDLGRCSSDPLRRPVVGEPPQTEGGTELCRRCVKVW